MKRSVSRAAWVVVFGLAALFTRDGLARAPVFSGGEGDGDELDRRIDDASVKVRADRPWKAPESPCGNPIQCASYRPYCGRSNWRASVTPFFWAPAMHGSTTIRGQQIDVDSSISETLEGVFDNFNFAGMVQFEVGWCRWSVLVDLMYVHLGNEEQIGGVVLPAADLEWDYEELTTQAMLGYRFARLPLGCGNKCFRPSVTFDALAGFRYYYYEGSIDIDPGPFVRDTQSWADPVVGVRMLFNVAPSVTFNVVADIGGFGVGSDLSWRLVAGINWNVNRCFALNAGWAILDVDYENGSFAYDVQQSGPYLGATFRF
jgi:hypothetical protein